LVLVLDPVKKEAGELAALVQYNAVSLFIANADFRLSDLLRSPLKRCSGYLTLHHSVTSTLFGLHQAIEGFGEVPRAIIPHVQHLCDGRLHERFDSNGASDCPASHVEG
jgi:hypothetical protein